MTKARSLRVFVNTPSHDTTATWTWKYHDAISIGGGLWCLGIKDWRNTLPSGSPIDSPHTEPSITFSMTAFTIAIAGATGEIGT